MLWSLFSFYQSFCLGWMISLHYIFHFFHFLNFIFILVYNVICFTCKHYISISVYTAELQIYLEITDLKIRLSRKNNLCQLSRKIESLKYLFFYMSTTLVYIEIIPSVWHNQFWLVIFKREWINIIWLVRLCHYHF